MAELPMYMVWHRRFQKDPAHMWLRALLEETVAGTGGAAGRAAKGR
jgi:hypothetical protein